VGLTGGTSFAFTRVITLELPSPRLPNVVRSYSDKSEAAEAREALAIKAFNTHAKKQGRASFTLRFS
jgi:hypothetical protein